MTPEPESDESLPTWRSIQQTSARKVREPARRRRRWIVLGRGLAICTTIAALGLSSWALVRWVNQIVTNRISQPEAYRRVNDVYFTTDGVLDRTWLADRLPEDPADLGLLEVVDLRERLLASGQVHRAEVRRVAPAALVIELKEKRPILRMVTAGPHGDRQLWLVADDGTVYEGSHYTQSVLSRLPFLFVQALKENGDGGFEPIAGIPPMAAFLDELKLARPDLFTQVKVVDGRYYSADPEVLGASLTLNLKDGTAIKLPARGLIQSLHRLQRIFEASDEAEIPTFSQVDLTLEHPILVVQGN